jgi:hypothetical protein
MSRLRCTRVAYGGSQVYRGFPGVRLRSEAPGGAGSAI